MRLLPVGRALRAAGSRGAVAAAVAACAQIDMNEAAIPRVADAADAATTFAVIRQGGTELNPLIDITSDGTPLQTAAGGVLWKIAGRAFLTSITGSPLCARAVTNAAGTLGAVTTPWFSPASDFR
jgi:hypothetical protein